jgi:protein O-mannosyl-transferase
MKKGNLLFILLCIAFSLALGLTYSNHFHNAFHFDDSHTIVDNAFIRDIKNIPLFFKDSKTFSSNPMNQSYRPLTTVTFAVDYRLGNGLSSTFYFHMSTFVWYIVLCVLLYLLFLNIFNTVPANKWDRYIALFGAAWYGLHAANAETVNYICQRSDVLSTLSVVAGLAIYAYIPKWRKLYIYLIPFIIGMLAKEQTVVFAPLLFIYILFFEKQFSLRDIFIPKHFVVTLRASLPALIACFGMALFVIKMASPSFTPGGASRFHYLITQPFVMLHYFIAFFLPLNLSADSDWKVFTNIFDDRVITGILFVLVMLYIAYTTSRKRETRPVAFGILWFFLALLPTSGVVPLAEVMNDHRMFFPFVGITLGVCHTLGLFLIKHEDLIKKKPFIKGFIFIVIFVILAGHSYGTYMRNKVWHTGESLWYDVTLKSPLNGRGMMNYGLTQMEKGNYPVALEYFEKALALTPYYSYLHVNLGILKGAMNEPLEAEKYFKNAMIYGPNNPETYYFYAQWLVKGNRQDEAVPLLLHALELSPAHSPAQNLLKEIRAHRQSSKLKSPFEGAEELSKFKPTAENYLNLSLQYHKAGRFRDSIQACNKALQIKPGYDLAYNNICAAYNEMKIWDKAIDACEKGLSINPDNQLMKNNLARAKNEKAQQGKSR